MYVLVVYCSVYTVEYGMAIWFAVVQSVGKKSFASHRFVQILPNSGGFRRPSQTKCVIVDNSPAPPLRCASLARKSNGSASSSQAVCPTHILIKIDECWYCAMASRFSIFQPYRAFLTSCVFGRFQTVASSPLHNYFAPLFALYFLSK